MKILLFIVLALLSTNTCMAQSQYYDKVKFKLGMIENCGATDLDDSDWQYTHVAKLPQNQALCTRIDINIDHQKRSDNNALSIHMLASRAVYFDGKLIATDGKISAKPNEEIPGPVDSINLIPQQLLTPGDHLLALQISNHHIGESISRWFYTVALVNFEQAVTLPLVNIIPALLFVGALMMMFVFFQLVFWRYRTESAYQAFSLLCLCSALLLVAEHYRLIVGYSYPWHIVRLHSVTVLTFASMALLGLYYLLFYRIRNARYWFIGLLVGLLLATLLDPRYDAKSILMFGFTIVYCLLVNLIALKDKTAGAKVASAMFAVLLLAAFISPLRLILSFIEQWFAFIYFVIILSILNTLIGEMRANRSQALSSARLESELLRRNLQPHFLMNSLMLIIEWIEYQPKAAVSFVQSLSEELRMLIRFSQKKEVKLSEEIELCRKHLEIMSQRYMSHYTLQVEGPQNDIDIPPAIIHTQIENAFSHNRIEKDAIFTLQIQQQDNAVTLTLKSPLMKKADKPVSTGTGEKYIHTRLAERYDNRYQYSSNEEQGLWVNRIHFKL